MKSKANFSIAMPTKKSFHSDVKVFNVVAAKIRKEGKAGVLGHGFY